MEKLVEKIVDDLLGRQPTAGCSWWLYIAVKSQNRETAIDIVNRIIQRIGLKSNKKVTFDVGGLTCACGLEGRHLVARYCSDKYSEPLIHICSPGILTVISQELRKRHILLLNGVNVNHEANIYRDLPVEASLLLVRRIDDVRKVLQSVTTSIKRQVEYILILHRCMQEKIVLPYTTPRPLEPGQRQVVAYVTEEGYSTPYTTLIDINSRK